MSHPPHFQCALIGYSSDSGGIIPGTDLGPKVLRERELIARLEALQLVVTDLGDVSHLAIAQDKEEAASLTSDQEKRVKNLLSVYAGCRRLAEKTATALHAGSFPIIIGGDHSLSIGSVSAVSNYYAEQQKKIGLIWIDTHPDLHTPETSPSKSIFGMSTAFLLGRVPGLLESLQRQRPAIDPKNIVYIGLRDVEPGEANVIREMKLAAYTMKEIDMYGLAKITEQAVTIASTNTAGFVVSFDLDVCDCSLVPGVAHPTPGGLDFREVHLVLELLHDSKKMLALELAELNPTLDKNFATTDFAIALIESAMGKTIL